MLRLSEDGATCRSRQINRCHNDRAETGLRTARAVIKTTASTDVRVLDLCNVTLGEQM